MHPQADHPNERSQLALPPVAAPVPYAVEESEPPPPTEAALGYSPARVLRALRRRWHLAIPAGLVLAAIFGFAAEDFIRADYTARTQVAIAISQPGILADGGGVDLSTYQRRQTALVKNRHVLQTAIDRPRVRDLTVIRNNSDPVGWLERELKADFKVPGILQITLDGPDPRELVVLLDAIREAYLEQGVNKETTDRKAALERVRALIEDEKKKLDEAQAAVTRKADEFGASDVFDARQRHQANLTRLANLENQLFQLDGTAQGWEQTRADLEARPPAKDAAAPIRPADLAAAIKLALDADIEAQAARADIARLEPQVIEYRRVVAKGTSNPNLEEKERELKQAQERLAAREPAVRGEAIRKLSSESTRDYDFRLREHEARLADLKAQIDRGRGQMKSIAAEIKKLEADTLAEAHRIAELDHLAAQAAEIADGIKVAKGRAGSIEIELRAPPRAETQETAVVVQVPNPSKKLKMVGGAVIAGFLAGLFGVAFLDLRSGRIDSPEGVDRHLHTGVVGCIPRVSPDALSALVRAPAGPVGPAEIAACDAADACRTLLLNALGTGPKVVMVTSAAPGEGKTALTVQLALSLGRAGKRTLLIDGDIRRPSAHAVFGEPMSPGLSDVLRKTHPLPNVVRPGPLPTVYVLPAGVCNPQEAVSLLQLRFGSLIRKSRPHFDVILIDTPPLLNLPDAMVIGRHADGTILSLMNEVSTLPTTQAACARLRTMNLPLLGAVLNGARVKAPLGY
jgi:capsular exopolysaccharide synthesis family protein